MTCNCNTHIELSREEISEIFGVEWVTRDYGIVRVKPGIKEPEILEYRMIETTVPLRELSNEIKHILIIRTKLFGRFGLLQRLLFRPCYKEKSPRILYKLSPLRFENVKFHWGGLWFEGDIVTKFENQSEEGKEGIAWVRRWQACPEDEEAYEWETIEGSASLLPDWLHKFWEDSSNTFISQLRQKLKEKIDPHRHISIRGHWKTDPLSYDTFMTMWSIFTSGTIVTRNGFDVTITYNFNGTQTKTYHVDMRVRLPIYGDVSWFNW